MTTSHFELEEALEPQVLPPFDPPPLPSPFGRVSRFRFFGTASEYFGIWFVNLLLTIVTLTLYSPWAKVRRLRYFYSHTELEGARFDFTGEARAIFLGRLLAILLYVGIQSGNALVGEHLQWLSLVFAILLYLSIPYLLRATYRFMSRNSIYRNSRFYFSGTLAQAFLVYLGIGILLVFSFGLLTPYYIYRHKQYEFNHLNIGQVKFHCRATAGDFYKALWLPMLMIVVAYVAFFGMIAAAVMTKGKPDPTAFQALIPLFFLFFISLGFMVWVVTAQIYRLSWSKASVGNSPFSCDLSVGRYVWIAFSNYWAKAFSFGLMTPWAVIRMHRYKVESLSITWQDDPNELLTASQLPPSAFGEELSDILGIDLSL